MICYIGLFSGSGSTSFMLYPSMFALIILLHLVSGGWRGYSFSAELSWNILGSCFDWPLRFRQNVYLWCSLCIADSRYIFFLVSRDLYMTDGSSS
jgi:hypothetical protein